MESVQRLLRVTRLSLRESYLVIIDRKSLSITCFEICYKMAAGCHFGCPKSTFDRIYGHFRSIQNFFKYFWQNGRRRPFWMSEIHFRSHFWPFQINTQLYFFWENLTKWLTSAILDVQNSLSIAFLAILDRCTTLIFVGNFWQNGWHRPFWMLNKANIQCTNNRCKQCFPN